jgi:hypothetical protein
MTDIDSTAEEIGTELATVEHQPTTLFRTDDPVEVLERAGNVADALKGVIDKQGLITRIKGREHVRVEGWTTLGSMLGVVPVVIWTKRIEGGWEARVEARTMDGRTIGAAESMCSKAEGKPWNERPDYALRSMAQTRATSKALRGPLGFVVTLAGYDATPAEEMPTGAGSDMPTAPQMKELGRQVKMAKPTTAVLREMLKVIGAEGVTEEELENGLWSTKVSRAQVSGLLDMFKEGKLPTGESDIPADAPPESPPVGDDSDLPFGEQAA